jgi:8-oxo-dGTP pyrophosphatase MutT (NUDIX family)
VVKENPWKTLSSAHKYGNQWFSVREDQVIRPDGKHGIYGVVSASRLATGILPLWDDGTLTLVGQYRYPLNEYSWEIPEGGGDLDLSPLETAKRELREETGIEARTWHYLGRMHTSNCFTDEVCYLFLAQGLTQGMAEPSPEEILQIRRVPFREAVAMAVDGRITDAISIVGIFRLLTQQPSLCYGDAYGESGHK